MPPKTIQKTVFSKSALREYYAYKKLFCILPPKIQNKAIQNDHPVSLEINIDPRVYPKRTKEIWHRDVWEKERFNYIKRRSPERKMDLDDPWVKAYQSKTEMLRAPAIINEVCSLLTLFTNYRFFTYDNSQSWFIPVEMDGGNIKFGHSVWGQVGFHSRSKEMEYHTTKTCDTIELVSIKAYYRKFRDVIDYRNGNKIDFPENINHLIDIYFSLDPLEKTAYFMACHLYNQALFFQHTLPSLSMVASVMSIEKIMNYKKEKVKICTKCHTPTSIEHCEECGAPIYKLRSRFREFMATYSLPGKDDLFKKMYDTRSRLAHGGLLREDLFDTGFYSGDNDDERTLRKNSLIAVHDALLHWLLKSKNGK